MASLHLSHKVAFFKDSQRGITMQYQESNLAFVEWLMLEEVGAEIKGKLNTADPTIYLMTVSLISLLPQESVR